MAVLALVTLQPSETAGAIVAKDEHEPSQETAIAFSTIEADTCRDDLAVCKSSVEALKGMVLENCEKPERDFELEAWKTAKSRNYSEDAFDCNYFSSELLGRLESMGYRARIVSGLYKGEPHAWVVAEVPIEATSGELITPNNYANYVPGGE